MTNYFSDRGNSPRACTEQVISPTVWARLVDGRVRTENEYTDKSDSGFGNVLILVRPRELELRRLVCGYIRATNATRQRGAIQVATNLTQSA